MKLELKNICTGPGSQETFQFVANLYFNDELIGDVENNGCGGMNNVTPASAILKKISWEKEREKFSLKFKELRQKIEEAETYCKTLPPNIPTKYEKEKLGWMDLPMDLDLWISLEVEKFINLKTN